MRRMICGLLALLALCAVPHSASAAGSWTAAINGGASVPTGDFASKTKGDAQTGWNIGGAMDYLYTDEWAFGADFSWNANASGLEGSSIGGSTVDKDKFGVWHAGMHAKYNFPSTGNMPMKWYGLVGAGFYGFTEDQTLTTGGVSTTTKSIDKRAGMNLGLGGTYWVPNSQMGFNVGADYHLAFLDNDQSSASSLSYMSAYVGVTFNIPAVK